MTDNGARALAERLSGTGFGWCSGDVTDDEFAAAILADGAVFLPDGREIERLRALSDAATTGPWKVGPGSWNDALAVYDPNSIYIVSVTTGEAADWIESNPIGRERARANAALLTAAVNYVRAALEASAEP